MKTKTAALALLLAATVFSVGNALAAQGGGKGGGGGGGKGGGGGGGNGGGGGGGGGGGNGGGGNNKGNNGDKGESMRWYSSLDQATGWAVSGQFPVMASIARATNADDLKAQEKIGSWPSIETISTTHFAAVKLMSTSPDAVELVKLMGPKSVPGLIWVDSYGNPILSQPMPDVAASITYVIANWKSTLASVDKFFKDHQARGDAYVKSGKLREAYVEYSMLAKFKGPNADKAKEAKALVTASWLKVAVAAAKLPVGSRDSLAMLKGLREEVKNLDFAAMLEKELLNAMIANDAAKTAVAVADGENKPAPAPVEATPAPVVAAPEIPAGPVAEAPVQTTRPLAELARTSTPVSREPSESVINVSYLVSSTNPALKQAGETLKKGLASYQKATADTMERGEPRNALLRSAHEDFDKTITLIENALAVKPDDVVRRLEERVSMMLYASLKYQSL